VYLSVSPLAVSISASHGLSLLSTLVPVGATQRLVTPPTAPYPPTYWPLILLAFLLPALLSFALTPLAIRLALRVGALAHPGGRRIHNRAIPKLGGLAIAAGVVLTLPLLYLAGHSLWPSPTRAGQPDDVLLEVLALALGGLVALAVGAIDDLRDLSPGPHFLGQLAAALTAVIVLWPTAMLGPLTLIGVGVNAQARSSVLRPLFALLGLPRTVAGDINCSHAGACSSLHALTVVFVVLWLLGMMNTVNFLDGIDGLAGGVVVIASVVLSLLAATVNPPQGPDAVLFPLLVGGAALGFLAFNWHPARIFMADTGAQFLGFALGLVALVGGAKLGTALIVLAVPILDVAWAIVRRRASFGRADRNHLHHRLLDLGLGHRQIVAIYYTPAIIFGVASVVLHDWRQKAALLLILALVVVLAMARLARAAPREQQLT